MDLNNPIITSNARFVTGRCRLNGVDVSFLSFDVDSNAFNSADTFNATFAISDLPKNMGLLNWWAVQETIQVELTVSIKSQSGTSEKQLIVGNVDNWHFDPAKFEVHVEGRDLTALLIDAKSAGETFKNYTASQIASMLAARHGLAASVTATKTKFGEFAQIDSAHLTGEQTEWDLLSTLAAMEDFDVYVAGTTLYFCPKADPARADNWVVRWQPPGALPYPQANVSDDLSFSRAMTISKGITVEVLSWHTKRKKVQFVASYPKTAKGTNPGQSQAKTQVHRVIRNGLTPDQAYQLAQNIYKQIVKHEMKMSGSCAGDNLLMPTAMIRVEGTQSPFDQLYYCDSVRRSFSFDSGYSMSFSGKNHSPAMEVTTE